MNVAQQLAYDEFVHNIFVTALEGGIDYWVQNRSHVRINLAHCRANPHGFTGYGAAWGLTSCDGPRGYEAFSPTHDKGVIAPTAALASMPYAPDAALAALRHVREKAKSAADWKSVTLATGEILKIQLAAGEGESLSKAQFVDLARRLIAAVAPYPGAREAAIRVMFPRGVDGG